MRFHRWVVFTFAIHLLVILVDKGSGLALILLADGEPDVVGAAHTLGVLPFVLMAIANLGLATSLVYHLRRKGRDLQVVAETTGAVAIIWGSFVGLGFYALLYFGVPWFKPEWSVNLWLALPICLCVPFLLLSSYYNSIQLATNRIKSYNLLHLIGSVSFLPLFLLCWWLFDQTVTTGIAFARLATAIFLAVAVLIMLRGVIKFRPRVHWGFLREGIAFGWKANITSTLTYLNLRLNLLILPVLYIVPGGNVSPNVALNLTLTQVAFYSLALTFAELVWHFPEATRDLFFSKIAGSTDEQAKKLTPILCRLCLLVSVCGGLALYPLVDPIMSVIIPDKWSDVWEQSVLENLILLLPGTVAFTLAKVLQNDLAARGHLNQCIVACCIVFVVMIGMDLWLIPSLGSKGAAIACTSGYFASSAYTLYAYKRSTGVPYHRCMILHLSDWQYIRDIFTAVFEKLRGEKK